MLEAKTAVCCSKPTLNSLQYNPGSFTNMNENGCHQAEVNGSTVQFFPKHSSPVVDDPSDFSPFPLRDQTPSPIVQTSSGNPDRDYGILPDTGTVSQGSSSCSRPASRPMTPAVSQEVSSPGTPVTSTDSPLIIMNHVTPRRPRHKPGERRELLTRAVEDVLNLKISMRRAAQKYNLAKSSLCDFVRKNKICLPNLRYKSCSTVSNTVASPSMRTSAGGVKRAAQDTDNLALSTATPQKLCGLDSQSTVLSRDTFPVAIPSGLPTEETDSSMDVTGPAQTYDSTPNHSSDPWPTSEAKANLLDSMNMSPRAASQPESGQTTHRFPSNLPFSKPGRIESPWHNAAGLPTQVPMRSWSTHGSQSVTSSPSGNSQNCLGRKIPFNSFHQLRQAMESSHNLTIDPTVRSFSEAVDLSDLNSVVNRSSEEARVSRPSDSFEDTALNTTDIICPVTDFRCLPVDTPNTTDSAEILNKHLPSSATKTDSLGQTSVGRFCATEFKNGTSVYDKSCYSQPGVLNVSCTSSVPGTFNFAPSLIRGEPNSLTRPCENRCVLDSCDPQLTFSTQPSLTPVSQWSVSHPGLIGALPSVLSTPPCSSLASILASDFSSLNQNAVAALLLQHSRTLAANPPGLSGIHNLISYPTSQPTNPIPSSLFPTDLTVSNAHTSPTQIPLTSSRPNISRPPNGSSASALNNLAAHLWGTDLSNQQTSLEDLQQLFCRQVQSRLQNDISSNTTSFVSPLVAQLIPQLYASGSNPSLRNLVSNLLSSVNPQTQSTNPCAPKVQPSATTFRQERSDEVSVGTADQFVTSSIGQISSPSLSSVKMNKISPHARGLVDFVNNSPSPFHAVQTACDLLSANGFREIKDNDSWKLKPRDCVFLKKNGTTVFAAAVGGRFKPGNPFHLLGAHTDSPSLRLKPVSDRTKEGYVQLGVEAYGGGLWYTWFDRELKVAGRVITANTTGRLEERLVHIDRPIACVPSLAVHLNPDVRSQGFNPNFEQHVVPILCTSVLDQVNKTDQETTVTVEDGADELDSSGNLTKKGKHPAALVRSLLQQLNLPESQQPLEVELYLSDCQPARIGGLHEEFIHAPRLDNLFNSYAGLHGLVESMSSLPDDDCVRLVCLYDHEEVGSTSTQGANSSHTMNILRRIANALASDKHTYVTESEDEFVPSVSHFEESLSKSFLLSADQAHAIHPSYPDKHETNHKPRLHGGLVLKCNSTQRYATNAVTAATVRQLARLADVPVQEFVVRQDMACGSTIGPLLSSQLGVPTADVGFPQLAMHSCRELCCTTSIAQAVRFYATFFDHVSKIWPANSC